MRKSRRRRILRYTILTPVIIYILLNLSGCFQFRMSNKHAVQHFEKIGLKAVTESYQLDGHTINFIYIPNDDTEVPAAIYIHGSPGSSEDFFNTMEDSAVYSEYLPVSVDRPGFGYSDFGEAEPSLDTQSKLIKPVLEKFRDRKIVLIGHSYGGPMVVKLAMDYPDLVDGIVIVAGSVDPDLEPHEPFRKYLKWPVISWMIPRAFLTSNIEIMALKGELIKLLPFWSDIKCPVIFLQGTKDNLVNPGNAQFADSMLVNSDYVELRMEKGGNHFVPFTRPQLIVNALITMLEHI